MLSETQARRAFAKSRRRVWRLARRIIGLNYEATVFTPGPPSHFVSTALIDDVLPERARTDAERQEVAALAAEYQARLRWLRTLVTERRRREAQRTYGKGTSYVPTR